MEHKFTFNIFKREEELAKKKIEDWENHKQGKGYRSRTHIDVRFLDSFSVFFPFQGIAFVKLSFASSHQGIRILYVALANLYASFLEFKLSTQNIRIVCKK